MRGFKHCFGTLAVCLAVASAGRLARADEAPTSTAASLVQKALKAEVAGDNSARDKLLRQALDASPELPVARWHAGYVRDGEAWFTPSQIAEQAAANRRLASYRQLRDARSGMLSGQVSLARWCAKNHMPDRERLHWFYVLNNQPGHAEARKRLGLREYRGMLLTNEQIEGYQAAVAQAQQAMEHWRPRLEQWRDEFQAADPEVKDAALRQLQEIDDAAAIAALESVLSEESEQLGLAVVAVLGDIGAHEATVSLVRHAVLSSHEQVRRAAADRLRDRPLRSFVPALLSTMQAPVEFHYHASGLAGQDVGFAWSLVREGPSAEYLWTSSARAELMINPSTSNTPLGIQRARYRVHQLAQAIAFRSSRLQQAVAQHNRQSAEMNRRIHAVLARVTQQDLDAAPQLWWKWWLDHNELLSYEKYKKPVYHQASACYMPIYNQSCFLRGTQVWTETGPAAIEQIRAGDRVLSQDPESGELAYKPVVQTTLRPASRTLRLTMDEDVVVATRGHPMWVVGRGWLMARQLEPGMHLHSTQGAVPIGQIGEGPEAEAYNLVVADFNTYFVGKHRVLVHDNTPRAVTKTLLPGLPAEN